MDFNVTLERSYPTPYANSSLLVPLLLSLASQSPHTPTTSTSFGDEYDYIIVGAGTAGSALAARLSEKSCVSILLLEAGVSPPLLSDVPAIANTFFQSKLDWQFFTTPQKYAALDAKNRKSRVPLGKGVGGSSITNGMLYVRGNRHNFDEWAASGAHGWSYRDVLPYFLKLENNTDPQYLKTAYHSNKGPVTFSRPTYDGYKSAVIEAVKEIGYRYGDINAERQTGFFDFQANLRNGQRCSVPKAYLVPVNNRNNLDIVAEAFVKKITIENKKTEGVIFDFQGQTHNVRARKEVIISAGALNTPKLLILSGIGPRRELKKHNITRVADLPVGRNFMDQCVVPLFVKSDHNVTSFFSELMNPKNIEEYIQNKTGPLTSTADVSGIAFLLGNKVNPKIDFPNYQLYFDTYSAPTYTDFYQLKDKVSKKFLGPMKDKSFYNCLVQLLQPKSRGTVTLNSTDPYDPPLIDPNFLHRSSDVEDIVQGLKTCKRIFATDAFKKMGVRPYDTKLPRCKKLHGDHYLRCFARSVTASIFHPTGTARMGSRHDPRTVVDPRLRVKGIKGLRVVDASVMPIITSGNTMVPTLMIAEKAADIIKKTIKDC